MRGVILPATRIVRGAIGAQLSHQFTDTDGNAADPVGTVTVDVTRADGTALTGLGAIAGTGTEPRTTTLTAAHVATVDWLAAEWSIDGVVVASSTTEIVGGVIMNLAYAKTIDAKVAEKEDRFVAARKATEDTLTRELSRSPFERFYTERIDGTGSCDLSVTWPDVIEVAWARTWNGTTSTALTASEVASIIPDMQRRLTRTDGSIWPLGHRNIEIGYRFGMLDLPSDLRDNLLPAIRHHLNKYKAGLNANFIGQSITLPEGETIRNNRPGVGASITGNDDLDATIRGCRYRAPNAA